MTAKELWTWVHYNYGDDLGLTTEDEDYVPPQCLDDLSDKLKEEIPLGKVSYFTVNHSCSLLTLDC